ncbi:MAG: hypothetical protein AABY22_24625, partial [Nanoarchaeota archaeon]
MGTELRHVYPQRIWTVNDSSPVLTLTQSGSGPSISEDDIVRFSANSTITAGNYEIGRNGTSDLQYNV